MTRADLSDVYRGYIACLNKQDWTDLGRFVHEDVHYNGKLIGLLGYREMLEVRDSRPLFRYSIANFRAASRREPLAFRLYAERVAVWPPGQWQESPVC